VSLNNVRLSNKSLQALPPGLVAVFAGATAGIGLGTLRQLAKYANGPRVYIIGRSEEKASHIIDKLKKINPMGTFIFIGGQLSLIKDVDRMCQQIEKYESHIDILCMSPGYLSFKGRQDTSEGLETDLVLQYYSRQRLVTNLLPLLLKSASPRVLSVLAAGSEGAIDKEDLEVHNKYSFVKATLGAATMTTLMFEELAKKHPTVSFIHVNPGPVGTHIIDHLLASAPGLWWYPAQIPRYTIVPVYTHFASLTPDEAGERTLFLATSERYTPARDHAATGKIGGFVERPEGVGVARSTLMHEGVGNGVYRVKWNGETCKDSDLLAKYRKEEMGKTVYEHTMKVFERAVGTGN
jgi:NAD(P)-dependent dehydrogenase (short-subunit alcohol dehydrogenase family)